MLWSQVVVTSSLVTILSTAWTVAFGARFRARISSVVFHFVIGPQTELEERNDTEHSPHPVHCSVHCQPLCAQWWVLGGRAQVCLWLPVGHLVSLPCLAPVTNTARLSGPLPRLRHGVKRPLPSWLPRWTRCGFYTSPGQLCSGAASVALTGARSFLSARCTEADRHAFTRSKL